MKNSRINYFGAVLHALKSLLPKRVDLEILCDTDDAFGYVRLKVFALSKQKRFEIENVEILGKTFRLGAQYFKIKRRHKGLVRKLLDYGPTYQQKEGFVLLKEEVPEVISYLRTKKSVTQSERAEGIQISEDKLKPSHHLDYDVKDDLAIKSSFVDSQKTDQFTVEEVLKNPSKNWISRNNRFFRVPQETSSNTSHFFQGTGTNTVIGDEIPEFLMKTIPAFRESGEETLLSDRVAKTRIIETEFLPKVSVDLDGNGWLWLDVRYQADRFSLEYHEVEQSIDSSIYLRKDDNFIQLDKDTHSRVNETIQEAELIKDGNRFKTHSHRYQDVVTIFTNIGKLEYSENFSDFLNKLASFRSIEHLDVPNTFEGNLREYQHHGYNWLGFLKSYSLKGILADDMGLGKTVQTIILICKVKDESTRPNKGIKCLVVCPTSVVSNWEMEFEKFAPGLKVKKYTGQYRKSLLQGLGLYHEILITSYSIIARDLKQLGRIKWDVLVLDEAQKIKNYETSTSKACKTLSAEYKLALTGTPVENRLSELWSIFDFLMPGYLRHYKHFRTNYEIPIMKYNNSSALQLLHNRVKPFILRRLKSDVAPELPEKIYVDRYCELTPEQVTLYRKFIDTEGKKVIEDIHTNTVSLNNVSIFTAIMRLKQICCHPALINGDSRIHGRSGKFEMFKEIIDEIIENEIIEKSLIFSQFVQMCGLINDYLESKGIKVFYLDGQTKNRQALVQDFNNYSGEAVFVISLRAGGVGLNLQSASNVLHYDRWWNPAVENQATDRAHRIGQTRNVRVFRIHTLGTIEEKIDKMQKRKAELIDTVISSDENMYKEITKEELKDLFSFED